jgi:hypothetical protein
MNSVPEEIKELTKMDCSSPYEPQSTSPSVTSRQCSSERRIRWLELTGDGILAERLGKSQTLASLPMSLTES